LSKSKILKPLEQRRDGPPDCVGMGYIERSRLPSLSVALLRSVQRVPQILYSLIETEFKAMCRRDLFASAGGLESRSPATPETGSTPENALKPKT
jgi:hypothetical protein